MESIQPIVTWPDPMRLEAFHGVAGDFVRAIEPHTEADPAALLAQALVMFGNLIGRKAYFRVEADYHHTNENVVIVGRSAKGRKGVSYGQVRAWLGQVDPTWEQTCITTGLSTGEGLIWRLRDPAEDDGVSAVPDKRLLVYEPEFSRVLAVAERENNTLSSIVRDAWDRGELNILLKKERAKVTGAHVSIIGHITADELRRLLSRTAAANGFANRFLWVAAKRSKLLPEGGDLSKVDFQSINARLARAAEFGKSVGEMHRDGEARKLWCQQYGKLSGERAGLAGAVTSRAEAHVTRLASIYALLDCSAEIRVEHLRAALALWDYVELSAVFVFGDALGEETADTILRELRLHTEGLTRTQIRDLFGKHKPAYEIECALRLLERPGLAHGQTEMTSGRPTERWFLGTREAKVA